MRYILRGAAIGLLAGTLFFFVPFLFRFFLFFLLISFVIRLFRGPGWRYRRHYARFGGAGWGYHNRFGNQPVSIDGGDVPSSFGSSEEKSVPVL